MLSVYEEEEVFFDTVDRLMSEESAVGKEDSVCSNIDYDIWLREPQSVKERREIFLCRMGFISSTSSECETTGLERVAEVSGAVSNFCGSTSTNVDENSLSERQESNSGANCSVDFSDQDWLDDLSIDVEHEIYENHESGRKCEIEQVQACIDESPTATKEKMKMTRWWKHLTEKMKKNQVAKLSKGSKLFAEARKMTRVRTEHKQKRCIECPAVYAGQEINAHNGLIWTMKFSPDGQYLASGGEDGVVCIWRVCSVDVCCNTDKCSFGGQIMESKFSSQKKKSSHPSIIIPEKIFHIEEKPLRKFQGHSSDVLDLSWSTSNHLLSSSMDRTVRLWQVGTDKCLGVFDHNNYVTCIQFNPVDENYFISGSIDGKVRIWGIPKRRVKDWVNARDIVTAVCYQPNGNGFVVGSVSGTCRFYETSGDDILLNAEIKIHGSRKKSSTNKITGIQFPKNDSRRMMLTSEDSRIRILDGLEVVHKYRGLTMSGTQMSASFTSNGTHVISVGEDSRIYMWNYDDLSIQTSKQTKSIRSFEHFFSEGVSAAIPWSDFNTEGNRGGSHSSMMTHDHLEASSGVHDTDCFSLANWFPMDGLSRNSLTWPEEKLPLWDLAQRDCKPCKDYGDHHLHQQLQHNMDSHSSRILSATWGLVLVTANWDGTIRTFHNYGLPIKSCWN